LCFSLVLELVYFKSCVLFLGPKWCWTSLFNKCMDEEPRKRRKIKFPSNFHLAWSCHILNWPCDLLVGSCTWGENDPHGPCVSAARPCNPSEARFGRFKTRHGRVPHQQNRAHYAVRF